MLLEVLLVGFGVALVGILIAVVSMWVGKAWFIQWLKGTIGMVMLFVGTVMTFVMIDIWTYDQSELSQPVATVSVFELDPQLYDVTLVDPEGAEQRFQLRGDQLRLDIRIMQWVGPFNLGPAPMYRFERLRGRYLSLEEERTAEQTLYGLKRSEWLDSWKFLSEKQWWLKADTVKADFVPLVNGAVYSMFVTADSVRTDPMNNVAERAIQGRW